MLGWLMSVTLIRWAKLLCCIYWMLVAPGLSRRFVDWIWMHRAVESVGRNWRLSEVDIQALDMEIMCYSDT
jgi:hypothetical protein